MLHGISAAPRPDNMRGGDARCELYLALLPSLECYYTTASNCSMKTIQEQLAEKANNADPQAVQYIGTVEAYDKWAEVCLHHSLMMRQHFYGINES